MMTALRLIHIVLGVFWAGTMFFFALYLEPSMREAGPDAMKVTQGLMKRGYMMVMPIVALLVILSGFALLWIVSHHFAAEWMGSRMGIALSNGMLASLIAFALGVGVMRPVMMRTAALGQAVAQLADGPDKTARLAELGVLRRRGTLLLRIIASLLAVAVALMAVARYL